jgi:2-oxoacid:acceptor oxidoreductase gamma subunit (pyruvate/2-ketoisovalerate family)/2-oxoacid:acceptor oxidoreductase delta subunit (pyruvate/2-ketoisovalerate family)
MKEKIIEIRWHGRGGQGVVTCAELIAKAAIAEGKYAQSAPSFGPERRGAPVAAFLRISEKPIYLRSQIANPDIVVVLDPTILTLPDVTAGIKKDAIFIANTNKLLEDVKYLLGVNVNLGVIDATKIALEIIRRPITNTTMLGSFVRATNIVKIESVKEQIKERFPTNYEVNIKAMMRGYDELDMETDANRTVIKETQIKAKTVSALPKWRELPIGLTVKAGSAKQYKTGSWRSLVPITDASKCIKCGICWVYCPDSARYKMEDGTYETNFEYCKGCGICARECPTHCIIMQEEKE